MMTTAEGCSIDIHEEGFSLTVLDTPVAVGAYCVTQIRELAKASNNVIMAEYKVNDVRCKFRPALLKREALL
jgi:hypothetical protein